MDVCCRARRVRDGVVGRPEMITADDIFAFYRPSLCRRRIFLRANRPELAAPPSDYDRLVMQMGQEHEVAHLSSLPPATKPRYRPGNLKTGADATCALVEGGVGVIYQGVLLSDVAGLAGIPDFLIRSGDSYIIRDAKLALNLDKHPEIPAQLSLYARAFADSFRVAPACTEVVRGNGEVVEVVDVDVAALAGEIAALKNASEDPDEAVVWSNCQECAFFGHCWGEAEEQHDPSVIYGIDRGMRNALVSIGVDTYDKLAEMPVAELAILQRSWGKGSRKVGSALAGKVQHQVKCVLNGRVAILQKPEMPTDGPCIWFDIEADPHDEGLENKVYLWGCLRDFRDGTQGGYWGVLADTGDEGDKQAWFGFLAHCHQVLSELGDVPFVHYSPYERTWVRKYAERWGDVDGAAARVQSLLWDMQKKAITGSVCLPVPSYGLKAVEKCAGFERTQADYGGLWSIVRYREWLEASSDEDRRLMGEEILRYNREDCEAMRRILDWVRNLSA